MKRFTQISIFLLALGLTACASTQSNMVVASGEDKDVGLGGTGMLATTGDADNGLGGTGILGEITGFGSIFVNGIEIEYDKATAFTIDGKPADFQQLAIGDVVEVLTTDANEYTHAQIINLRHEVIGKVESIDPQTFSFTVQGQTVVQPVNKRLLPEVGSTVAVAGFRVDKNTIVSTRVEPAAVKTSLLRTGTALPFKEKTSRWLVQMHVQENRAAFQLEGATHVLSVKQKAEKTYADRLGIKILQLQKPAAGQLKLERVIEPGAMPRGQRLTEPSQWHGGSKMNKPVPGAMPGPGAGSGFGPGSTGSGSGAGSMGGSGSSPAQGPQPGSGQMNMNGRLGGR